MPSKAFSNATPRRQRRRNIIWFNPPFSKNVKTNVARRFLKLIDKHFPRTNKLHKIFNMNTVKVSYSCMPNMKAAINTHNTHILSKTKPNNVPTQNKCNCRRKEECPIPENCLATNVINKAEVTTTDNAETKKYIGMTSNEFKVRYRNHTKSFRDKKHSNETELSKYIWDLKKGRRNFSLKLSILKRATAYHTIMEQSNVTALLGGKTMQLKSEK